MSPIVVILVAIKICSMSLCVERRFSVTKVLRQSVEPADDAGTQKTINFSQFSVFIP